MNKPNKNKSKQKEEQSNGDKTHTGMEDLHYKKISNREMMQYVNIKQI